MVKVSGCRPAEGKRLGYGRRPESAHGRTRGGALYYGDLKQAVRSEGRLRTLCQRVCHWGGARRGFAEALIPARGRGERGGGDVLDAPRAAPAGLGTSLSNGRSFIASTPGWR